MGAVLEFAIRLQALTCGECGMEFAAPEDWVRKRRAGEGGNRSFHCPSGHARHFVGETEEQRLTRELAAERSRREAAEKARGDAETTAKRERTRRHRLEQRARGGLCPRCQRSFVKLAAHMKTKHPDFGHTLKAAPD